jgi:hypothetical protein
MACRPCASSPATGAKLGGVCSAPPRGKRLKRKRSYVLHHIALLCAPSGYVLRGASGSVFSLLSTKSLVELQHIIGTGCGGRCVGRVADYPRQAAGARQSPRSGDIRSSRRRVRESPPDDGALDRPPLRRWFPPHLGRQSTRAPIGGHRLCSAPRHRKSGNPEIALTRKIRGPHLRQHITGRSTYKGQR